MSSVQNGTIATAILGGAEHKVALNQIGGVLMLASRRNISLGETVTVNEVGYVVRSEKPSAAKGVRLYVVEQVD